LRKLLNQAFLASSNQLVVYFLPTLLCQFKCFYCLEHKKDKAVAKTVIPGLEKMLIKWLKTYLSINSDIKKLKIVFFGGEPLLRKDLIKRILAKVKFLTNKLKVDFVTELITNGELIEENIMESFLENNLRRIQITLDGFREEHNKVRFSVKGGSFDKIVENIIMIIDKKYISMVDLRISLMEDNFLSIKKLLRHLYRSGLSSKISLTIGVIQDFGSESSCGACTEHEEFSENMAKKYLSLILYGKKLGFNTEPEFVAGPICFASLRHSVVVKPDGGMQKCFCSVGQKKFDFANIFDKDKNMILFDQRYSYENNRTEKCFSEKCPFVPVCNGGCVWRSIFKNPPNGYLNRNCNKTAMSIINSGLIKSEFCNC
jgi:uncharacterized protein